MDKQAQKNILITEDDLRYIFGDNYQDFKDKIIKNVWCGNCSKNYSATIVDYSIELNDLNDVELNGKCKKCGYNVGRYVETGENPDYVERIKRIKKRN